jgi:quercetin dioxygenase-like cupin family protein
MEIVRANTRRSDRGPEDWFSGSVWLEPIVRAPAPARVRALRVTFAPRARTAWHRHPFGQALEIVSGRALVGRADGTVEELTAGDTVWFEPAERHWHGASPDGVMVHIAIQEADEDGRQARWEEHVTDEQYGR